MTDSGRLGTTLDGPPGAGEINPQVPLTRASLRHGVAPVVGPEAGVGAVGPVLPPTARSKQRRWITAGLIAFAALLAVGAVIGIVGATYGLSAMLLGAAVSVLPLAIVVPTFLWLDRFEAEPTRYLVTAFLWGAGAAALGSLLVNSLFAALLIGQGSSANEADQLSAIVSAPLVEETLKGLFVLLVFWLRRREFDGIVDGLVYAGITAAGFAFTENILYLAQAYIEHGGQGLFGVAVLRGIFSPFLHPMFTCITGIGIGIAAMSKSKLVQFGAPVLGWCIAVLLHAVWNGTSILGDRGFFQGYLFMGVPAFLAFIGFVVWARQREGRIIGQYLLPYADAGWISRGEVQLLADMRNRRQAQTWAKLNGGKPRLAQMRQYQDVASELALLRRRMSVVGATPATVNDEQALLHSLTTARHALAGSSLA